MRTLMCVLLVSSAAMAQEDSAPFPADKVAPKAAKGELDVTKMTFTPAAVKQVMSHNNDDQIQGCYEETLASKDKPVEGKLMTSFTVTAEGLVSGAKVLKKGTTLKDDKLHSCVVTVLSGLTFPKPADKRDHPIEYPFNLKAQQ
jgi:hypothetical protein